MDKETKDFVYMKNGWGNPNPKKPKIGTLVAIYGNKEEIIMQDKPFALLNWKKQQIKGTREFAGCRFKIRY